MLARNNKSRVFSLLFLAGIVIGLRTAYDLSKGIVIPLQMAYYLS